MRQVGHFIGGKEVAGTSGRFADVFQPMDGSVIARVSLATKAEMRQAVENAREAQVAWAATNPQRRARVMMKFLELIARDMDALAELLAREHGKTIPDAKGDIQRGVEVAEFACGIPHLLKGEYTEGAGPGIDVYSMRQPLGVVAGITPFNFPAMIPMWKFAPAIACGNAFILKPSERDPGVPMRLAELMLEAVCRPASSTWSTATRKPWMRSSTIRTSARWASWARRRSPNTSIPAPRRRGSARSASAAPRTT
jgi:malonate-semialdehyde dehydrogenase (acetylating)/methylmalonate-semialdehyde dehydrogenase